jgi:hypothetical protein
MSNNLMQPTGEVHSKLTTLTRMPSSIILELTVTDADSVKELDLREHPADRHEYALGALRIGLLSLRHARGQIDADAVKREGERLLDNLNNALGSYRTQLNESLTGTLKEYFDPNNGRFPDRLERLIKRDGELEQVLRRHVGLDQSELAKTLAATVGENSPLMRLLDPEESDSLVRTLRDSTEEVLQAERARILSEFSLDNKESALSRLISELTEENAHFKGDLAGRIEQVVGEFSLDRSDSALSRLVAKVEDAQTAIAEEFSLDNNDSALSRMSHLLSAATDAINNNLTLDREEAALARLRRELLDILKRHEIQASTFQSEVTVALEAMKIKREEASRTTTHGNQFEDVVVEFLEREATRAGDLATGTGNLTGAIKYCKVGDAVVELGPDCTAAGEKFVVEAKEDSSFDLSKARLEIEMARKNREAAVGVFVFSKKTAPARQEAFVRLGNDIFIVWNAEDLSNDIILKAALSLAKALCVREAKLRNAEAADFQAMDSAILAIETEAARLVNMKTWTETMRSNSGKILEEIRKLTDGLEEQLGALKHAVAGLRRSAIQSDQPRTQSAA